MILTVIVIAMTKHLFKKYLPHPDVIKSHKNLRFLGQRLQAPNLWHLNRHSVAIAFAVGLFCAWIPTPTQMAMAAMGALYFRGNLPVAVGLVWLTNPITMPPLFYFAYLVGLTVLNMPSAEFSLDAVLSSNVWLPFLTGCFIIGTSCSLVGYFGIQYFWAYHTRQKWLHRKAKRKAANPFRAKPFI